MWGCTRVRGSGGWSEGVLEVADIEGERRREEGDDMSGVAVLDPEGEKGEAGLALGVGRRKLVGSAFIARRGVASKAKEGTGGGGV